MFGIKKKAFLTALNCKWFGAYGLRKNSPTSFKTLTKSLLLQLTTQLVNGNKLNLLPLSFDPGPDFVFPENVSFFFFEGEVEVPVKMQLSYCFQRSLIC